MMVSYWSEILKANSCGKATNVPQDKREKQSALIVAQARVPIFAITIV